MSPLLYALPWLAAAPPLIFAITRSRALRRVTAQVVRMQAIMDTAAAAIISVDADGRIVSTNRAATGIFGHAEHGMDGQPVANCIPGLNGERLHALLGELESTPGPVQCIVRQALEGQHCEGRRFPIEITLSRTRDDAVRYVCIVRDLTDERAALETSALYERALASSHNGVFITDATMAAQPIVFINDAFQRITGLAPQQVLGLGVQALRGQRGDDAAFSELRMAIAEARSTNVTLSHALENGRLVMAEVSLSPIRAADGRLTNFVGIVSDVSDRVRAEHAIAERSARLDSIFSLSPDGFVLFDAGEQLKFANPAFERMTGIRWQSSQTPARRSDFEQALAQLCHADHPLPRLEADDSMPDENWTARIVLSRPQHRVLQAQARRNFASQGDSILYFRDVTHQDEVDRMKSEFLASAAHELRTPMVSIFGFTELLLKRDFSTDRRNDMLQTIHRQSGLLVKMINELLDLARIESRRGLDMHIASHPLRELVAHSVRGLMRQEGERQVQLGAVPDVMVLVDPEKMQLALINLLGNAFKYSPAGGDVVVSARLDQRGQRPFAVLQVQDHGMGMTPEQLQRAFERFYRADTTGNIPGTGLGLSLVREVADLHGGVIELESTKNVGTLARLWIPLDGASASAPCPVQGAKHEPVQA